MDVHISLGAVGERTEDIYRQLSSAIVDGRIVSGEALPPSRVLAATLGISRTTVAVVYDRLLAEGFVLSRRGAGTFVAPGMVSKPTRRALHGSAVAARSLWAGVSFASTTHSRAAFDFAIGVPDPDLFRWWRGAAT